MIFCFSGDFVLKNQIHSIPITTNGNRPIVVAPQTSSYRIPSINGRLRETMHHSDNERQVSFVSNGNSIQPNMNGAKYDNYARLRSGTDTITLGLKRDKRVLDFGFSISDRLYGTGVYVNKIRPNGPAELEGTLIPCMRIYQVFL